MWEHLIQVQVKEVQQDISELSAGYWLYINY